MKKYLISQLHSWLKYFYPDLDKETLSKNLYYFHVFSIFLLVAAIVLSHTVYPMFWLQCLVFVVAVLIWLQHIFLQICICTFVEQQLSTKTPVIVDGILELFGMEITNKNRIGVTFLFGSLTVSFLGLELFARSSMYFREKLGLSVWV